MFTIPTSLPDDPALLQQMLRAALAEIERQRLIIAALQRNRFGRRSEKLGAAAVQQGIEDVEQSVAEQATALEATLLQASSRKPDGSEHPPRTEPAKRNRGALPAGLPRVEQVIDVEDKTCPCCRGSLHLIGETTTEMCRADLKSASRTIMVNFRGAGLAGCDQNISDDQLVIRFYKSQVAQDGPHSHAGLCQDGEACHGGNLSDAWPCGVRSVSRRPPTSIFVRPTA